MDQLFTYANYNSHILVDAARKFLVEMLLKSLFQTETFSGKVYQISTISSFKTIANNSPAKCLQ